MPSIFEKMIADFSKKDTADILEDCMSLNAKKMKKIPVRYRLIAVGFVSHMSLEQLNNKLEENGCEKLYARNPVEASLIFAFQNGLSYSEWSQLEKLCEKMINRKGMEDPWFNQPRVTYRELEDYIRENSRQEGGQMNTGMVTQFLKKNWKESAQNRNFLNSWKETGTVSDLSVKRPAIISVNIWAITSKKKQKSIYAHGKAVLVWNRHLWI